MPKSVLLALAAIIVAGTPISAYAQDDGQQPASTSKQEPNPANTAEATKRGISEEGGMKASGPSQAKGGESR